MYTGKERQKQYKVTQEGTLVLKDARNNDAVLHSFSFFLCQLAQRLTESIKIITNEVTKKEESDIVLKSS